MKVPNKLSKFVDEINDEGDGNLFVWLKKPFAFEPSTDENRALHCRGMYETLEEIIADISDVQECPCGYCRAH